MLMQARTEKALPEMLIIAAGLSIPDPRERPEEKRELANAAHKAFACARLRLPHAAQDLERLPRLHRQVTQRAPQVLQIQLPLLHPHAGVARRLEPALRLL
jgi:HrpA-like RNA helicase